MTAPRVLLDLVEAGVVLWVDAGLLRYRAPAGAVDAGLRDRAAACRGALVALVATGAVLPVDRAAWPEGWREAFEERAGIVQFEAGRSRELAEREAEHQVRVEHVRDFLERSRFVVTPAAGAVATYRPGDGPHRRP